MKKILVVDDSAFLRARLRDVLERELARHRSTADCLILEAGTKADALWQIHDARPDLVLLDIVLDASERDGVDILRAMRNLPLRPKVVVLSSVGQDQIVQECLKLGAESYLFKPFNEQEVLAAVRQAVAEPAPATADVVDRA